MQEPPPADPLFANHSRNFAANWYVYPVLSRRAAGLSIGVNINRDKFCNFRCIYCQVDRDVSGETGPIDLQRLTEELDYTIEMAISGEIFAGPRFCTTPPQLRRLNDIAISGDGEPTACAQFDRVVEICAAARRRHKLDAVKLVLITNASLLHRPMVRRALETLDANNGEIWAKLDAGTDAYYQQVARSQVPWRQILDNLRDAAMVRPIVIQSLFMRVDGRPPFDAELEAYCNRLSEILAAGGQIKMVQIHTIARKPAETWATPLPNEQIDAIAELVRSRTRLAVAAFHSGG